MKKLFIMGFLLLSLASCASYDQSIFTITPNVKLNYINAVSGVRERDGQIFVQVTGQTFKNQEVYYKTEWFDRNGIQISTSLSKWKNVKLIADIDFTWKMMAPSKKATSYKVYITDRLDDGIIH